MELTVLVDNNTLIDRYFRAEPGISLLIEDQDTRVLFDTGYSDLFLSNATKMGRHLDLQLSQTPVHLGPRLVFLGEIPRDNSFEGKMTFGKKQGHQEPDRVMDDSALVYKSQRGLVIITGCSHAGICNIIAYAQRV